MEEHAAFISEEKTCTGNAGCRQRDRRKGHRAKGTAGTSKGAPFPINPSAHSPILSIICHYIYPYFSHISYFTYKTTFTFYYIWY
jgi:hypothetical protein